MLVDSHCHLDRLDLDYFKKDLNACLDFAREQGVLHFLCVCIDLANFPAVLAIAEQFKEVSASVGVHPTEQVAEEATLDELIKLAQHPLVVAIGETGLDYYRKNTQKECQQQRFRQHIRAAIAVNKPLIVHTRQAREETLNILRE
ncbi:MAG: TatD family hydrolase, partial [Candidatus Rickettsiella isopodorum]|nr:TatD family hydrolase [Candidatus Rickettsiella isopodorum]